MELRVQNPQEVARVSDGLAWVTLDVESTAIGVEALDNIAYRRGDRVKARVCALTHAAMNGELSFGDALNQRIALIAPTPKEFEQEAQRNLDKLAGDIGGVVVALQQNDIGVALVSGGFHPFVDVVARELNIVPELVFANDLVQNENGLWVPDPSNPLAHEGGKKTVLEQLTNRSGVIMHVGDGGNDLSAMAAGAVGVFYGGFVPNRPAELIGQFHASLVPIDGQSCGPRGGTIAPLLQLTPPHVQDWVSENNPSLALAAGLTN